VTHAQEQAFCNPAFGDALKNLQALDTSLPATEQLFALENQEDAIRRKRTGPQWRARIEAQLNLRADFFLAAGRFDQNRLDYLDAVALVREAESRTAGTARPAHRIASGPPRPPHSNARIGPGEVAH
jgi:hypothetical protein